MKYVFWGFGLMVLLSACEAEKYYATAVRNLPPVTAAETDTDPDQDPDYKVTESTVAFNVSEETELKETPHQIYYVILGSFINPHNALDFKNSLFRLGFDHPCIIRNDQGLYRVAAGGFSTEAEAQSARERIIQFYPQYMDAWLLGIR